MAKVGDLPLKEKINFKVLFSRYYQIVTVTLAALILVLGAYFILLPKYRQASAKSVQVFKALEKEEAKRADYLKDLEELLANYQKINQQDVSKLKTLLPADKDLPGLFVQLQGLAEESNFLLAGVSINEMADKSGAQAAGAAKAPPAIKKLAVNLNLVGSKITGYSDLKSFLADLELNLRLFDVEAVYFTPESPKYSLMLSTYYSPQ